MTEKKSAVAGDTKEAPSVSAEKRPVSEWAAELGYVSTNRNPGLHGQTLFRGAHAGAVSLHAWAEFAYHNAREFECTREVYQAAVAAALSTNDEGRTVPHAPADCRK